MCLYFHFFLLQMCNKWEGVSWGSCSFFALLQIFAAVETPPALLKTASFPSRTFANIRHFHHRLGKKKWKRASHFENISFYCPNLTQLQEMQFPCLPFPSPAHPWSRLQHLLCQSSHQGELPSPHKLLPGWLFIFSAALKLSGKDGEIGWTSEQGMALQSAVGSSLQDKSCFFWEHPTLKALLTSIPAPRGSPPGRKKR